MTDLIVGVCGLIFTALALEGSLFGGLAALWSAAFLLNDCLTLIWEKLS